MDIITGNVGWIEVICGPMFSGKSEELIRRLRRAMIARKRVEVFKPTIDNRYSADEIVSHGDLRMRSQVVSGAHDITERIDWRSEVVGFAEAKFMGPQLVEVAQRLADFFLHDTAATENYTLSLHAALPNRRAITSAIAAKSSGSA